LIHQTQQHEAPRKKYAVLPKALRYTIPTSKHQHPKGIKILLKEAKERNKCGLTLLSYLIKFSTWEVQEHERIFNSSRELFFNCSAQQYLHGSSALRLVALLHGCINIESWKIQFWMHVILFKHGYGNQLTTKGQITHLLPNFQELKISTFFQNIRT
jgi:hypothetical protein